MDLKQYIEAAKRTESGSTEYDAKRVDIRILHGIMGLVTESGELMDAVKKSIFYEKELDRVNLVEELGDIMWYMAILIDALDTSFEEVATKNITKLQARYPEKFSAALANNRDLDAERKAFK